MLERTTPFDPTRRQWLQAGASLLAGFLLAGPSLLLAAETLDAEACDAEGSGVLFPGSTDGSAALSDPKPTPTVAPRSAASPPSASTPRAGTPSIRVIDMPRSLSFYNTRTNEHCRVTYWRDGGYDPEALRKIDYILRDDRANEVKEIDRGLLDLVHDLQKRTRSDAPIHVISGYRSPATNSYLRSHRRGVAGGSLHMDGRAIDLSIPGIGLKSVRATAIAMNRGGVGYYPRSKFVHVDVGEPRTWRG
jgi:uncharacterized protein YcbK (DUF882 family)